MDIQMERVPRWDLADRLRKSLRDAGIGVQEMANYLDVSRTSVSNWINGRNRPGAPTLRLWAMRTGVSYLWLRKGDGLDPMTTEPAARPSVEAFVTPLCDQHGYLAVAA